MEFWGLGVPTHWTFRSQASQCFLECLLTTQMKTELTGFFFFTISPACLVAVCASVCVCV